MIPPRAHAACKCAVAIFVASLWTSTSSATTYIDDFFAGLSPSFWNVSSNQPLYTIDDTNGDVRINKPEGGSFSFQYVELEYLSGIHGDFDISVDFRDAQIDRITGQPGNQVQLNVLLGSQFLAVVRSDEIGAGHNYHVWVDPPAVWQGGTPTTATSGRLRVTRTGATVTGYFDDVPVYSMIANGGPVTRLWCSLQNNGTTDATSVTFDNFTVVADTLIPPSPSATHGSPPAPVSIFVSPNPFLVSTTITYTLAEPGMTNVSIYDVTGRRVVALDGGPRLAGAHRVEWDGRNERGAIVPSGVYFAGVEFGGQTVSSRIVHLR